MSESIKTMDKKKINILFPIETIARELDYKLFLGVSLASKNVNVVIAQHDYFNSNCSMFKGGVYLGKNIFKCEFPKNSNESLIDLSFYNALKACDITLLHLDEEGAIFFGDENRWRVALSQRLDVSVLEKEDYLFTWGSFQKKYYESQVPSIQNDHIVDCGHPKFELNKSRFRFYFEKEISQIKEKYGSFVLINTNLTLANNALGLKDSFSPRLGYNFNDEKLRISFVNEWAYINETMVRFVRLIHRLSIEFPNKTFVLRPHPSETPSFYRTAFFGVKNIHVENTGAVSEWIMAADLVIHDGCTTAIEAFLASVPIINYKPIENLLYDIKLPNQLGIKCKDEEEVIQAIIDIDFDAEPFIKMNSMTPNTKSLMKNLESDTYDDFVKLLDILVKEKLNNNDIHDGRISISNLRLKEIGNDFFQFSKNMLRIFYPERRRRVAAFKLAFPGFNRKVIEKKIRAIEHFTHKKVYFKYLSNRLLVITSREQHENQ